MSVVAAAVVVSAIVAAVPLPPPSNQPFRQVTASMFGQHVHDVGKHFPSVQVKGERFGAVRLWDNGVRWDEINPRRGVYQWQTLDTLVSLAEQHGVETVMYVPAGTPRWASPLPDQPSYMNSPGSNVPPALPVWGRWVRKVVKRYGGRITDYQVWNEGNLSSFWYGTPKLLAEYTKVLNDTVRRYSPQSSVVTASLLVRQKKGDKQSVAGRTSFTRKYFKAMRGLGLQGEGGVDKLGVHSYPWVINDPGSSDPTARLRGLAQFQRAVAQFGFTQPLSDTEVGYGNRRANGWPHNVLDAPSSVGYITQTFVQSLAFRVANTFWYGWDDHVLGVDLTDSTTGEPTAAGEAFFGMQRNLTGSRIGRCVTPTVPHTVGRCTIRTGAGETLLLVWGTSSNVVVQLPPKAYTVTNVQDGNVGEAETHPEGDTLTVGYNPVLVRFTG